jgi:hypothetical protein
MPTPPSPDRLLLCSALASAAALVGAPAAQAADGYVPG